MKVAVVGSGIAGLASAWLLAREHQVTLLEAAPRLGGHTHTVDITVGGQKFPVDTGFLVFNHRTYPELTALFAALGVATVASDMSFSVKLDRPDLEWAGSDLNTVFGQRRNLGRPAFWAMLSDLLRFNREAPRDAQGSTLTLGEYLDRQHYGRPFVDWYLLPMAAAIWSCPTSTMLAFPLASFVRFCVNHGLLQILDRPQWHTVAGGGREYVRRLAAALPDIRLGCPALDLRPVSGGLELAHVRGREIFDQVVLACHSDEAETLVRHAWPERARQLSAIAYQPNRALLHTDASFLPRRRRLWSAWNYEAGPVADNDRPVAVHYLINRLQPLPTDTPVIVSLNPFRDPAPETVHGVFDYSHPVFTAAATAAQTTIRADNGTDGVWFAGAWLGYGFHEDGLKSALDVARGLAVCAPWRAPELADAA